jgi:hypothetical protein
VIQTLTVRINIVTRPSDICASVSRACVNSFTSLRSVEIWTNVWKKDFVVETSPAPVIRNTARLLIGSRLEETVGVKGIVKVSSKAAEEGSAPVSRLGMRIIS